MRPKALLRALRFDADELFKWDFVIAVGFAVGGLWIALESPGALLRLVTAGIATVGIVVGAVIAGAAILGAFLDQAFLRKLRKIEADPVRYFAPFFFTVFVGTIAAMLLLILLALSPTAPTWVRAALATFAGLTTGWTLGSLIYDLDMLVQFIELQKEAADVPDDQGKEPPQLRRFGEG